MTINYDATADSSANNYPNHVAMTTCDTLPELTKHAQVRVIFNIDWLTEMPLEAPCQRKILDGKIRCVTCDACGRIRRPGEGYAICTNLSLFNSIAIYASRFM